MSQEVISSTLHTINSKMTSDDEDAAAAAATADATADATAAATAAAAAAGDAQQPPAPTVMEGLSKTRSNAKRQITRTGNQIKRAIAEDSNKGISQNVDKLKDLFKTFEIAHEEYHDILKTDKEMDTSEDYFDKVQDEYTSVLNFAKDSLTSGKNTPTPARPPAVTAEPADQADQAAGAMHDMAKSELLSLLNIKRAKLDVYDGDPMRFHEFTKAFDLNIDKVTQDSDLKLSKLMEFTTGSVKESLRGCLLIGGDDGYKQARSILTKKFGAPHLITEKISRNLRLGKPVRSPEECQQFSNDLKNAETILTQMNMLNEISTVNVMLEMIGRFPSFLQSRWKKKNSKSISSNERYCSFSDFVTFITTYATEVNDPYFGSNNQQQANNQSKSHTMANNVSVEYKTGAASFGARSNTQNNYAQSEQPCVLCKIPHRLWHCPDFKALRPRDRLALVNEHKLCHNCLLASHSTANCGKQSVCKVCKSKHTMWIHVDDTTRVALASLREMKDVFMPVVKVMVNNTHSAIALLDSGSSSSFCSRTLAAKLGLRGTAYEYTLQTVNGVKAQKSELVNLSITSDNGNCLDMKSTCLVDSIPVKRPDNPDCLSDYSHLSDIQYALVAYDGDMTVDLLIGQDHAEALVPIDVRRGEVGDPFAVLTLLGWSMFGQVSQSRVTSNVISSFVCATHNPGVCDVEKLWSLENEGVADECGWSQEDKYVISLWDKETIKVGQHYEIPPPWRDPSEKVPNNFFVAKKRLDILFDKKFKTNPDVHEKYKIEIDKLVENNYAEEISNEELFSPESERVWYLPHHYVTSEKKPDRVRVVFDCASKYKGQSLNDRSLQGPDLLNRLLAVLLRFRENGIAIQSDLECMYYQVLIPPEHRDMLRFLFYVDGQLRCFKMTRHVFGAIFSSASSAYALKRTVSDFTGKVDPLIKHTVDRNFYVDDCLSSVRTLDEGKLITEEMPKVLETGGFNARQFASNVKELMEGLPEEKLAKEMLDLGPESEGKALGVRWNFQSDTLSFQLKCDISSIRTKREMLSVLSSIYDPLQLLSPLILPGKLIFQQATSLKLSWDDPLPDDVTSQWKAWARSLDAVSDLRFPRCIKPSQFDDADLTLHHFSDGSNSAYGCVTYLRCLDKTGSIHVQLVISKCKVSPLKQCTIPRIELQAAVLAAKLDAYLRAELDLKISRSYFWVDAEIVLRYIHSESRRFKVFVANRVSQIRKLTNPDQWSHIPGKLNPADVVSRGKRLPEFDFESWVNGPRFLHTYKCDWQVSRMNDLTIPEDDPETKKSQVSNDMVVTEIDPLTKMMHHYSSWYRMKRALAWWLRVLSVLRKHKCVGDLSVQEIRHAGNILVKKSQEQSFQDEIDCLSGNKSVSKSSPIAKLSPFVDSEGILRIQGRLGESNVSNKHPCILSGKHVISTTVIRDLHNETHVGVEWSLSILRKHFWVTRARNLIKSVSGSCVICKRLYGKPLVQFMSDLPKERVEADKPPFSNVAVDVFGTFHVKYGRSEIKRYGCLYTCLCSRAVHVEMLNSLDVHSYINCFRRFTARRGQPEFVYSDQATNFVAADAELKRSIKQLSKEAILAYAVKHDMVWKFNPPMASHMNGAVERMIGVFRRVMSAVLPQTVRLTDEILETTFCEVESILNNRPLVKMNDDPNSVWMTCTGDAGDTYSILLTNFGENGQSCTSQSYRSVPSGSMSTPTWHRVTWYYLWKKTHRETCGLWPWSKSVPCPETA